MVVPDAYTVLLRRYLQLVFGQFLLVKISFSAS